jgi:subtilisin family serine protease
VPDEIDHGTHVSGTIAADGGFDDKGIYGMAPEADLHEYKVLGFEDLALGIYRAADLGSDIMSMSVGEWYHPGTTNAPEKMAEDYAAANNVLVVAAAGNGLPERPTITSPAKEEGVVAVGALDKAGRSVWWSSPGFNGYEGLKEYVMFAAPGNQVLSTIPTYRDAKQSQDADGIYQDVENFPWYVYWSGTSMATPHISGTAAKILADGLYNGMGISQSNPDYVKGIMQGYARDYPVTEVNLKKGISINAEDYVWDISLMANEYAGSPPGDYYSALLEAIARGDDTMVMPGDPHNNCLAGYGVPRLPVGST